MPPPSPLPFPLLLVEVADAAVAVESNVELTANVAMLEDGVCVVDEAAAAAELDALSLAHVPEVVTLKKSEEHIHPLEL